MYTTWISGRLSIFLHYSVNSKHIYSIQNVTAPSSKQVICHLTTPAFFCLNAHVIVTSLNTQPEFRSSLTKKNLSLEILSKITNICIHRVKFENYSMFWVKIFTLLKKWVHLLIKLSHCGCTVFWEGSVERDSLAEKYDFEVLLVFFT